MTTDVIYTYTISYHRKYGNVITFSTKYIDEDGGLISGISSMGRVHLLVRYIADKVQNMM